MRLPWLSRFLPWGDDIKSLDPRDLTLSWQLPSLDPCAPWIPYVLRYCPCERPPGLRAWGRDFLVVSVTIWGPILLTRPREYLPRDLRSL